MNMLLLNDIRSLSRFGFGLDRHRLTALEREGRVKSVFSTRPVIDHCDTSLNESPQKMHTLQQIIFRLNSNGSVNDMKLYPQ